MYESLFYSPSHLFGQFEQLRRELDDLFGGGSPSGIRSVAAGSVPAMNVGRTANSIEIFTFAPGLDASKIDVSIDRGVLRISGERVQSIPQAGGEGGAAQGGANGNGKGKGKGKGKVQIYSRERPSGAFTRAVNLPDDIDPDKVDASYRDGVLQISVGRREASQPKRINVQ